MGRPRKFKVATIEEALRAAGGIHAVAAQIIRGSGTTCSVTTISNYVRWSRRLQRVVREVTEINLDLCEAKVLELGLAGGSNDPERQPNLTALIWYMKIKGKHRGYTERAEVAGAPDNPLNVRHTHTLKDYSKLTDAELDAHLADQCAEP
jgi:hypothetical protein